MPPDSFLNSRHPLWLVGFRPFFALAMLAGALLPLAWMLFYGGAWPAATLALPPTHWHAHEMFLGFGGAVLGGFLLTASKNWVSIRGFHGPVLMALALAWLVERLALAFGALAPPPLVILANLVFWPALVALILWTLIRHRATDSYPDNVYFILALPLFLPAKALMLMPEAAPLGWSMAIALFRLVFLVMLERTLAQFMKNALQVTIPRWPALDHAIKMLALILVFAAWMPKPVAALLALGLALLVLLRTGIWSPHRALRRLDIGIMILGKLGLAGQLLVESYAALAQPNWLGAVPAHAFTFGAIGLIVPAMLVRIAKGHTGRTVTFEPADKLVLWLMIAAFVIRVPMPVLLPDLYRHWLHLAALAWTLGFGLLAWRYLPFLVAPRVDGKEH